MKKIKYLAMLFLFVLLGGCSSLTDSRSFVHPDADFSFYQKVGVISFSNQTDDQLAGEKVSERFVTELLIAGTLDVMDQGQLNGVIAQVAKSRAPVGTLNLTPTQLSEIADVAGVQGLFMGTIHDYKMLRLGGEQYPMISMTVKFIDAPTGTVAWQDSVTTTGGPNYPIISVGETYTMGQLTQDVCEKVAHNFFSKAYPEEHGGFFQDTNSPFSELFQK
jgi:PBP1b-binding outer membrane lipoprotein LpoB